MLTASGLRSIRREKRLASSLVCVDYLVWSILARLTKMPISSRQRFKYFFGNKLKNKFHAAGFA